MDIFSNHRKLYGAAFGLFVFLSLIVAILPALNNQNNNAPLPGMEEASGDVLKGKMVFIANGCVACHSQQVRNVDMDKMWGKRPNVAADYAANHRLRWWMNSATLMGTERTGPDLTDIGNRLPAADWHLLHLYNPRAVVSESIMPSYKWMFDVKEKAVENDKVVNVPEEFRDGEGGVVVAGPEALQLVAYLQSLRQVPLPDGKTAPAFLYTQPAPAATTAEPAAGGVADATGKLDGAQLYAANCQVCHQAGGLGLAGAFPSLKGSSIVLDDNPEVMIDIVLNGYNAREEYGEMPAVGMLNNLSAAEIAAIINHERSSWGNHARQVPVAEVERIVDMLKKQQANP